MKNYKNRNREKPVFANINLQGPCNYQCYFCLGKDISLGVCHNYLNKHFSNMCCLFFVIDLPLKMVRNSTNPIKINLH